MSLLQRFAAGLLFSLSMLSGSAHATAYSTDQSDLWWAPSESGWGMQMVQRNSLIFATIYIYSNNNAPVWYTALLSPTSSVLTWSGDLYLTSGPWFGAPTYNPATVGIRKVGAMTWVASSVDSGVLTYSVDGVSVIKNLERFPFPLDNFAGTYLGASATTTTQCNKQSNNGTLQIAGTTSVTQNGQSITVAFTSANYSYSCTMTGTFSQLGQFGNATGTYSCSFSDGIEVGNFSLFEMAVGLNSLSARFEQDATNNGCVTTGDLGGMRQH